MNESRRFYLTVAATKVLASVAEDQPTLGRALCLMFKEQVLGEEAHLDGESPEVCTMMHILALTPYPSPRQKENKQESVPHTPSKEINKEKTHTPPEPTLAVADLFKKFWSAYPRKVGKTTCLSKFERIFKGKAPAEQRSLLERMLSAIRPQPGTTKEQCLDCIAYTRVIDAIRHLGAKKVTMVTKATPITPTDYIPDEDDPDAKSEGIIVAAPASATEWKREYHNQRKLLRGIEYKMAVLLEKGWSLTAIKERLHLSDRVLKRKVKNLQVRFAQCFSGYKAHLAKMGQGKS